MSTRILKSRFVAGRLTMRIVFAAWFSCCVSCQAQFVDSQESVDSILNRMRANNKPKGAWQSFGIATGQVLQGPGEVQLAGDEHGRFRLELDSSIKIVDVYDGESTTKLFPWGNVTEASAQEEEMTLMPLWIATGYWLSRDAPLDINAGPRRSDHRVSLIVKHREGKLLFEVLVDPERAVPLSVSTYIGQPMTVWRFEDHRTRNGWPVAGTIRLLKEGQEFIKMELEQPRNVTGNRPWEKPRRTAVVSFSSRPEKIAVKNDGQGFLFVRPRINGHQLGWFLFDTGAPATILGKTAVQQLELERLGRAQSTGVGGSAAIEIHSVESLQLGALRLGPIGLASMDVSRLGWRNIGVEGILGADILNAAVVEYDIASSSIQIHDPAKYQLPGSAQWTNVNLVEGKPIVRAEFEGHEGEFLMDTAAGGTFSVSKHVVDQFDLLRHRSTRNVRTTGVGGGVTMRQGILKSLYFGGLHYENVSTRFSIAKRGSYAHPYPDGIIGINLLDDYRLIFELGKKRVAFLKH